MSTTRYIELNSTYRDRNIWPLASEFEVPISQTGRNNMKTSIDPVSLSMPIFSWTSNNLIIGGGATIGAPAKISDDKPIQYSSDQATFVILTTSPLQQLKNYYTSLVMNDNANANNIYRRISSYYYLGSYIKLGITYYRAQISVYYSYPDGFTYGDTIVINDPTDFSDPYVPLIWVPDGSYQENAYIDYILYNETCNQYRPILHYDNVTNMIQLDTSGSSTSTNSTGPITVGVGNWSTTDNFSLRKRIPTIPDLGSSNPTVVTSTNDTIQTTYLTSMSTEIDFYKNYFIRILPYGDPLTTPTDTRYEYDPKPSNNAGYRIVSYTYDSGTSTSTFKVYPSLKSIPSTGTSIEILPFSYDNFNPFSYNGSLVSQQDMVCYEVKLSNITVPNATLKTGNGGRASFYPFLYVQLSNVSAPGAGLKNILYSNNPHTTNVIFKVIIYDIQNPLSTPFVRVSGETITQTIKFKPNDNLYFKVTLPNGDPFETILDEYYSPCIPNPLAQISALFSFRRI